ncbi:MAG: hypothetical protein R6W66_04250 [Pelovirga sp.]
MKNTINHDRISSDHNTMDPDVLVERGRQLHSAAIGDVLITMFRSLTGHHSNTDEKGHGLPHAAGHRAR